jgi:hypothetical protein
MNPLNQFKATPPLLIALALLGFALLPKAQAVVPPPDGGYPNFNTAEGQKALFSLTSGVANTAAGWFSLGSLSTGSFNTATGAGTLLFNTADSNTAFGAAALLFNTTGDFNTANGTAALLSNTEGFANTATGFNALRSNVLGSVNTANGGDALQNNTTGSFNTATGANALFNNTEGDFNTATGSNALVNNTTGEKNTATGYTALQANIDGGNNNAIGYQALLSHQTGDFNNAFGALALVSDTGGVGNTAVGTSALLSNSTGSSNTAIGSSAGFNSTTGDGNVYIGAGMLGVAGENDHTYIRNINTTSVSGGGTDTVTINLTTGLLGHLSSSRRYKQDIKPMENTSETLYQLKPVTYRYKKEIDSTQSPAFGLIAEEVAEVNPDLVARNAEGLPETVQYEMVNAMLLNEFLKEHRKNEKREATIAELKTEIASLSATVNEQAVQIQKVSAQLAAASPSRGGLEASRPAPQVVKNP